MRSMAALMGSTPIAASRRASRRSRPGGIALFEIGQAQAEAVSGLLAEAGLPLSQGRWRDLAGRPSAGRGAA